MLNVIGRFIIDRIIKYIASYISDLIKRKAAENLARRRVKDAFKIKDAKERAAALDNIFNK